MAFQSTSQTGPLKGIREEGTYPSLPYALGYSASLREQRYHGTPDISATRVIPPPGLNKQNTPLMVYRSLSWMFGFKEKYSLVSFVIFGGALIGYCLSRAYMMNPAIMRAQTTPGEFRWFNLSPYKINYILHISLSVVGGIFVGLQFLPAIRRKSVLLHRLNGYLCLALVITSTICGGITARRGVGGEINSQSAYYILGLMVVFAAFMGYFNVKRNTRIHRKWMLRFVTYFCVVISEHLIVLCARQIVSDMGSFYSLWRCDEIFSVINSQQTVSQLYPQCSETSPSSDPANNGLYVPVHASLREGALGTASAIRVVQGMCLWIAIVIHILGIEYYIQNTESLNYNRHGYVLEPRDFESESSMTQLTHF